MKKMFLFLILCATTFSVFSQAREEDDSGYRKVYAIILSKNGEVKHIIKQGEDISADIDGKNVNGRWFFKAYPDIVEIVDRKNEVVGEIALNQQDPLQISVPQPKSGMSVGIGVGPVSVSNMGGGMQSFNMEKWKAEISERMETKEEKLKREYYEQKEQERQAKEAAKAAKKAAKKSK
ncbi:MAG: hypothetical protein KDD41_01215 [Flavobacteriales bacterium]|nr:hypothetical protein [Flavobacteriales bacterium]